MTSEVKSQTTEQRGVFLDLKKKGYILFLIHNWVISRGMPANQQSWGGAKLKNINIWIAEGKRAQCKFHIEMNCNCNNENGSQPDPNQNVTGCSLAHASSLSHLWCISVQNFLLTNKQTVATVVAIHQKKYKTTGINVVFIKMKNKL